MGSPLLAAIGPQKFSTVLLTECQHAFVRTTKPVELASSTSRLATDSLPCDLASSKCEILPIP